MALGELGAILPEDERAVSVLRELKAEGLEDQRLAHRVGEMLLGARDGGDPHQRVVDGDAEVVDGHAVGAQEDEVAERGFHVPRDPPAHLLQASRLTTLSPAPTTLLSTDCVYQADDEPSHASHQAMLKAMRSGSRRVWGGGADLIVDGDDLAGRDAEAVGVCLARVDLLLHLHRVRVAPLPVVCDLLPHPPLLSGAARDGGSKASCARHQVLTIQRSAAVASIESNRITTRCPASRRRSRGLAAPICVRQTVPRGTLQSAANRAERQTLETGGRP